MASPAERYADARRRAAATGTRLESFTSLYPFGLDPFQVQACQALEAGSGVLVAAPTGSGKTVVGEFAVHLALAEGRKCFYTTPIKALSNQKYADLVARYGADQVGLLTGDNSVNGEAPVVVMTTEVLRNMLYAGSGTLGGLGYVVMDEVHYLADRFRGAVWEEVIIHLPESVSLVSLSATVSNAEEFGEWLETVRGDTEVVVEEHRPVPLWQHVMVGRRLYDLFVDEEATKVNPELVRLARDEDRYVRTSAQRPQRGGRRPQAVARPQPGRGASSGSTPRGCCRRSPSSSAGPAATPPSPSACTPACACSRRRSATRSARSSRRAAPTSPTRTCTSSATTSGSTAWSAASRPTTPGCCRRSRRSSRSCSSGAWSRRCSPPRPWRSASTCRPGRSCSRSWSSGTARRHADVTPGEYTQLTGRAGRRGIDVEGHAVVLWQPGLDPSALAGLASTRTYPLRSSLPPVVQHGGQPGRPVRPGTGPRAAARRRSRSSRPTGPSSGWPGRCASNEEALEGYREAMTCHLGDFEEYAALRRALADREAALSRSGAASRRAQAAASLEVLRPGDVIQGAGRPARRPGRRARPGQRRVARTGRGRRC